MKAILVSAFLSYEPRLFMVKDALDALGVKTQVLLTDFDHRRKALREDRSDFAFKHDDITFIPTRLYRKNLSLARLLSHVDFAFKAKRIIEKDVPDILYCLIAPNSVGFLASCIKKKHPQMKLIIDVCDMWPEAFPAKCANRLFAFPFLFWRLLRTSALKRADCVLTECNRFSKALANYQAKTVFWSLKKVSDPQALEERLSSSAIHLAYLGSINHILDIERTASLIRELAKKKPVTVHVIGMGEKKTEFLKALRESGATVIDYGAVFEERRLGEIFSYCHAGLNVMKKEVFVGLSMKTLAYFKFGLPVINSLEGDTKDFIERYGVGFQLNDAASLNSISVSEIREMKKRVSQFFSTYLESSVIMNRMLLIFKEIVGGGHRRFSFNCFKGLLLSFSSISFSKKRLSFPFWFSSIFICASRNKEALCECVALE